MSITAALGGDVVPVRGARREPRLSEGDRWGWIIGCLRAWKRSGLRFLSICDVFGEREERENTSGSTEV